MSGVDSGFADLPAEPSDRRPRRRWPTVAFLAVVLVVVGFIGWAWSNRVHADDVDAWLALRRSVVDIDRELLSVGRGEQPPCVATTEGFVERQYATSSGTTPATLQDVLDRLGWAAAPIGGAANGGELTRTADGRELRARIIAGGSAAGGPLLRLTSQASPLACWFR